MQTESYECGQQVRGMKPLTCKLRPDHKGYHSAVVFFCDSCDRAVRGEPYRVSRDRDGEVVAAFCFPCVKSDEREYMYA